MRTGTISFKREYVVDLDDEDMVAHAKESVYEDVMNSVKHDSLFGEIEIDTDSPCSENDIPDFLLETYNG